MRWFALICICGAVTTTFAEPDPKKYQTEVKFEKKSNFSLTETKLNEKQKSLSDKKTNNDQNTSLSDEERKFLRDVEEKFSVKSSFPVMNSENITQDNSTAGKLPFPAVIAIEIVNETNSKTKDKRTIDANLGFGYRTNTGYSYTYFGKPKDKGKFMIYPYSQQDIPPVAKDYQKNTQSPSSTIVEIKPSQAYELLPLKEEHSTYQPNNPVTEYKNNYDNFRGYDYPRPPYPESQYHHINHQNTSPLSTFYTTYNGKQFSGFTKQFPTVAANYFVDPSQLLKNPQYQSIGLTQAHLNPHNSQMEYRVVPVLVLKVPSTYLKDPSAELYSDTPNNYLNNIDLQQLVHDYFKKIGYAHGPQLMAFQNPPTSTGLSSIPSTDYESQKYSSPYVVPTYTQSHVSGVQYSGVNPVMAKYPKTYNQQDYYTPNPQSHFHQPGQQQQDYQYQYVPRSSAQVQQFFYHQKLLEDSFPSTEHSSTPDTEQQNGLSPSSQVEYSSSQIQNDSKNLYTSVPSSPSQYEPSKNDAPKTEYSTLPAEYAASGNTGEKTEYWPPKSENNLYSGKDSAQYDSSSAVSSNSNQDSQGRSYQNQPSEHSTDSLVISENYPSKDHTIATILPYQYKPNTGAAAVQSVSYVTPVPSNYRSRYNVMVQQTVFKTPTEENVSYVHSQSLPHYARGGSSNTDYNTESEYTIGPHIVPPVGTQKPAPFPKNYHTYQKRMTRPHRQQSAPINRHVTSSERTLR